MQKYIAIIISIAVFVTACSPAAQTAITLTVPPSEPTTAPTEVQPTAQPELQPSPTQESMALPTAPAVAGAPTLVPAPAGTSIIAEASSYNGPAWATLPLVDARTLTTFTLADFAGKTVFVEPMATWCTNCRAQLPKAEAARAQLDPDKFVFVGLSVAENVDSATLASYVASNGWNFAFAVASEAFTQGIVDTFGRTAVTPPSTPHFIIRPDGTVTDISTGTHTTEELIAQLQAASGA